MPDAVQGSTVSGEYISMDEACQLIEQSQNAAVLRQGGMSMRLVKCQRRGEAILVEGSNGEFALIRA